MELLDLGIKIDENWYSVGNTNYNVFYFFTLRFKDFIRMVNFFWIVCLSITIISNRYIWIIKERSIKISLLPVRKYDIMSKIPTGLTLCRATCFGEFRGC